ncbi:MAG: hypothetical protein R3E83_23805 [Burkholderiaceae bacterium]
MCGAPGEVSVINAQFDASRDFPFVLSTRRQIVVTAGFPNTLDVVTGVLQAAVAQGVGTPCP